MQFQSNKKPIKTEIEEQKMENEQEAQFQESSPKNENFEPIKLSKISNVIWRRGYYVFKIINADDRIRNGKRVQTLNFEGAKGKCKGFRLRKKFYEDPKSRFVFSILCNAIGIIEEVKDMNLLVGKLVKLRIVPPGQYYRGKRVSKHIIIRFHPVD